MFWLVLVSNPPACAVVEKITIANAVQISFVLFILKKLKILDAKVLILFYISLFRVYILNYINSDIGQGNCSANIVNCAYSAC